MSNSRTEFKLDTMEAGTPLATGRPSGSDCPERISAFSVARPQCRKLASRGKAIQFFALKNEAFLTQSPRYNEVVYYQQWETDTHRDHRDFRRRKDDEQKEYWTWRHSQDHDHARDNH
jgi:hypothetical protein